MFNPDRFVIIDGVQISKTRALRDGLIDEKGRIVRRDETPASEGPGSTRARTSSSVRRGRGGSTKATGKVGSKQPKPAADGSTGD